MGDDLGRTDREEKVRKENDVPNRYVGVSHMEATGEPQWYRREQRHDSNRAEEGGEHWKRLELFEDSLSGGNDAVPY